MSDEWQPIETAPKDGRWLLLEGEMRGGDTSCVMLGRWEPLVEQIGNQMLTYEWRCLSDDDCTNERDANPENAWNWYPEGRVAQWMPLP